MIGKKNNTDYWKKKSCEYSFSQVEIPFFCCWIHEIDQKKRTEKKKKGLWKPSVDIKFSQVETWKSDVFTLLNFIFSSHFFFFFDVMNSKTKQHDFYLWKLYLHFLFVCSFVFFFRSIDIIFFFFSIWSILFFSIVDIF